MSKELDTLQKLVKKAPTKKSIPHVAELLELLFEEWGGVRQFVKNYHRTYQDEKTNSMTKAKMLESVMRLAHHHAASQKTDEELGLMTEADLESAARELLNDAKAVESTPGRCQDDDGGTPSPVPASDGPPA